MNVKKSELSLDKAWKMLGRARKQARGEGSTRKARSAAGKVWSAATMAAGEILGKKPVSAGDVFIGFWRAWGRKGLDLAEFLEGGLYRGSFLSSSRACTGRVIEHHARRLARLFRKPPRKNRGGRFPRRDDPPPYVVKYLCALDRFSRRDKRIIRDYLPAPGMVRTLIPFFKERLNSKSELKPFIDEAWSVKYDPRNHLHVIEWEAGKRTFSYLIAVLRMHRRVISSGMPKHPDWKHRHAIEALEAVGMWWKDHRRSYKVYSRQKKKLDLCAKIRDLRSTKLESTGKVLNNVRLHSAALKWVTKHLR